MLYLNPEQRKVLWKRLIDTVEQYVETVPDLPVTAGVDLKQLRAQIGDVDFSRPLSPAAAVDWVAERMSRGQVHTAHPGYYGLFNPNPTAMGIAADTLVAAFNPQLAAWSHNPFACEVERHLIQCFGEKFGYPAGQTAGSFTSGGAEANHTAVLAALVSAFPEYPTGGAAAVVGQPVLYVSEESHHSVVKAARLCGIGTDSVTTVPLDADLKMDTDALEDRIARDRKAGRVPFLVVATLGSTSAGLIDPVDRIADVAGREKIWLHADAAWGGAAALVPDLKGCLAGIERADSITFDAHKWLSVPMGAGMFFTRRQGILEKTFAISTGYMPVTADRDVFDPHLTTMQWSRRFIGLKVFMSLLVAGWEGYEETIAYQTGMGNLLRERLKEAGWNPVNKTPLPTVCFVDSKNPGKNSIEYLSSVANHVLGSGKAWISTTSMGGKVPVLRACITNHRTGPDDIGDLIAVLNSARKKVLAGT